MAQGKYYAVAAGRQIGIFRDWPTTEAQVKGFAGARYKGFASYEEARAWLAAPPPVRRPKSSGVGEKVAAVPVVQELPVAKGDEIVVFTDGGCLNNPGPGGYGIVICTGDGEQELSGGYRLTTNNRMEMTAAIVALRATAGLGRPVRLYSDSTYLVNGIMKGWARKWRQNGWRKADRSPAVNSDLWAELLDLLEGRPVSLHWLKGHAGYQYNERCDRLANGSARGVSLPEDTGYCPQ